MTKHYSTDEVIRMVKPNSQTYTGMPQSDREDLQARYQQARQTLNRDGVSVVLQLRMNALDKETEDMPPYSRKSVLINAIRYDGMDGWTNPHSRRVKE